MHKMPYGNVDSVVVLMMMMMKMSVQKPIEPFFSHSINDKINTYCQDKIHNLVYKCKHTHSLFIFKFWIKMLKRAVKIYKCIYIMCTNQFCTIFFFLTSLQGFDLKWLIIASTDTEPTIYALITIIRHLPLIVTHKSFGKLLRVDIYLDLYTHTHTHA